MDSRRNWDSMSPRLRPLTCLPLIVVATLSAPASHACYLSDKVLRDGIASVMLAGTPPPALELASLGKVRDSQQHDLFSIWQIANPTSADVRVELAATGNYRIPALARAGTHTIVRSDRASGSAAHQLLVGGSAVSSEISSEDVYTDFTELSDAECAFAGNPLYVAEQQGSLKISTVHGATVAEITSIATVDTLTTEQPSGVVWTLSGGVLRSYDPFGAPLQSIAAPGSGFVPSGLQHLAVEADENLWLVRGSTLYRMRLSSGNAVASVTYSEPIREVTYNPRSGRLWVLLNTTARIVRGTDNPAHPILEVQSIALASGGQAITYDAFWSEMWIATTSALARYDVSGTQTASFTALPTFPTDHVVADGAGGVWGVNGSSVFHVDSTGTTDAELEPFAGLSLAIVDVAADPADGTVWVASDTRIRNYSRQETLIQDIVPTLPDGVIRQFRMLDLFADRTPPWVRIVSPQEGAVVNTPRPVLEVEYADIWGSLALDTLELRLEAALLPVDCVPIDDGATCTLGVDLPAGEVTVQPSIVDIVGNESSPAPRNFIVVSNAPPVVTIDQPADGALSNVPEVTLTGSLDQPATLTIDGQSVTVTSGLAFEHTVTLQEGPNTLTIVAEASSGARAQFDWHITLDTIPPGPPSLPLIAVELDVPGMLRVIGQSGSVEPNSLVRIRNVTTGVVVSVVADNGGAFTALIVASIGDQLSVAVVDEAGNEDEETQVDNSAQRLRIKVLTPSVGMTVDSRGVIVSGNLVGPMNTGVAVNGVAAVVSGMGVIRNFVAEVPLTSGENVLTIAARLAGGAEVTRTVRVFRAGDPPFSVEATPDSGVGPLDVAFIVRRHVLDQISRIEIDFDGDSVFDLTDVTPKTQFTHRYEEPGIYLARFQITTQPTEHYLFDVLIAIQPAVEVDAQIQAVWQLFTGALSNGNSSAALQHMTAEAAQRYQSVFNQLQAQMPAIVASFSMAEPIELLQGTAEYIVRRPVAGAEHAFFIYFIRAADGTWRVASM